MDGAGVVALIILIAFFSNLSLKPFQPEMKNPPAPAPTAPVVQQVQTAQPPEPVSVPVTQPDATAYRPISPPPPIPSVVADHSPAAYQFVDYDRMEAIIRKYNRNLPQEDVDQIKVAINLYCREKDIDPRLVLAVIARESGFNPFAVSSSGAIGLGQIMPYNYDSLGISNPNDINQNVKGTVYYLREKMSDWAGSQNQLELSIASYTKGTGDIRRANGQFDDHTQGYIEDILKIRASI